MTFLKVLVVRKIEPGGRLLLPESREPIALLTVTTGTRDHCLTLRDHLQILTFKSTGISQYGVKSLVIYPVML